ncbi:MAG: hypothetical protein Q4G58_08820 [bacterium]|nr:hypothetical protein [bacterium]
MKSIPFTQEQINILSLNPYTASVSTHVIRFTLDFKVFALKEAQGGSTSTKIFEKAGYDPKTLGKTRMYNVMKAIKREAASARGLQPPKGLSKEKQAEQFAKTDLSKKHTATAIRDLQDKVVQLEEKIEFLSKLFF